MERRESYRCQVTGPRSLARLKIDGRMEDVEIVDESASGFCVLVPGADEIAVGRRLLLQMDANWSEIEVMRVLDAAAPDDPTESETRPYTQLGVRRVRDLEDWEIEPKAEHWWSEIELKSMAVPLMPLARPVAGVVALIIGAPLVAVLLVWALEHAAPTEPVGGDQAPLEVGLPKIETVTPRVKYVAPVPKSLRNALPLLGSKTAHKRPPAPLAHKPLPDLITPLLPKDATKSGAVPNVKIPRGIARGPKIESLLRPEIARSLDLSREQVDKLRRISEEGLTAAGEAIEAGTDAASDAALAAQRTRRSMAVLTAKQRDAWQRMMSQAEAASFQEPSTTPPGEGR
jgi:hypothetical protein